MLGQLSNVADPEMVNNQYSLLVDGSLAEESGDDHRWMKFEKGHYEVVIDLKKNTLVRNIMLRTLNYAKENINAPLKIYVYASDNGESFDLLAIKDAPFFQTINMMHGLTGFYLMICKRKPVM